MDKFTSSSLYRKGAQLLVAAALAVGTAAGCSSADPAASEQSRVGSVRLPLQASGPSGTTYALTNATIAFSGPTTVNVATDPAETTLVQALTTGEYSVQLLPGWQVVRVSDGRELEAQLVSANPVPTTISEGQVTDIMFVFNVGREEIPFGSGQARVSVSFNETASCSLNPQCTVNDPVACVCQGCVDNGVCDQSDDCVCDDCATDAQCVNNCNADGICDPYAEGCGCADCATNAECALLACELPPPETHACAQGNTTSCVCDGCVDDGVCANDEDCLGCADCVGQSFCANLCNNNGVCNPWLEQCDCADCAEHPACSAP